MKKKYLRFYKNCMKTGLIPYVEGSFSNGGLCSIFEDVQLFEPLESELQYTKSWGYWGTDDVEYEPFRSQKFTPLRQNIVLFLAAMNNEL